MKLRIFYSIDCLTTFSRTSCDSRAKVVQYSKDGYARYDNLFVCFVALRPKSTAMVIAGRSVHLTTLFPGQA